MPRAVETCRPDCRRRRRAVAGGVGRPGAAAEPAGRGDLDRRRRPCPARRRRGRRAPRAAAYAGRGEHRRGAARLGTPAPASCAASAGQAGSRSLPVQVEAVQAGRAAGRHERADDDGRRRVPRSARCGRRRLGVARRRAAPAGRSAPRLHDEAWPARAYRRGSRCPARRAAIGLATAAAARAARRRRRAAAPPAGSPGVTRPASAGLDVPDARRRRARRRAARRAGRAPVITTRAAARRRSTWAGVPGASAPRSASAAASAVSRRRVGSGSAGGSRRRARRPRRPAARRVSSRRAGVRRRRCRCRPACVEDGPLGVRAVEQVEQPGGARVGAARARRRGPGRVPSWSVCRSRQSRRRPGSEGRAGQRGGRRHGVTGVSPVSPRVRRRCVIHRCAPPCTRLSTG